MGSADGDVAGLCWSGSGKVKVDGELAGLTDRKRWWCGDVPRPSHDGDWSTKDAFFIDS